MQAELPKKHTTHTHSFIHNDSKMGVISPCYQQFFFSQSKRGTYWVHRCAQLLEESELKAPRREPDESKGGDRGDVVFELLVGQSVGRLVIYLLFV